MNAAIHYSSPEHGVLTACGRDIQRVACWDDRDAITCKRCVAAMERTPAPAPAAMSKPDALAALDRVLDRERTATGDDAHDLARLAHQRRELEDRIGNRVRAARDNGLSWSDIGAALGISKQGAQQRYGAKPASPVVDPAQLTID
jgi:hypothetical protein